MKRQLAVILFVGLFAAYIIWSTFIVAGCGGGGGGGGGVLPAAGSSNWDEMVWDQDNWG